MKKFSLQKCLLALLTACACTGSVSAQGLHFSQYYNAPLLLNPANTGLMSDNDYRIGVNYRKQWSNIVPYTTISAYADFQFMRERNQTNWLGLGFAFFNDKAGDGVLTLNRVEGNIAYHIMLNDYSMISAGLSGSTVQRSLNFNKLTFDSQWVGQLDGSEPVTFDINLDNKEQNGIAKLNYYDVAGGINYASFPNEFTYIRVGVGLAHVLTPKETFYSADTFHVAENKLGFRPIGNADVLMQVSELLTINPSLYYTMQKKASEFVLGALGMIYVGGNRDRGEATQLLFGAHYRWNESVIGSFGLDWGGLRFMASYDYTVSSFSTDNKGNGAIEFALSYQGMYGSLTRGHRTINCPRF